MESPAVTDNRPIRLFRLAPLAIGLLLTANAHAQGGGPMPVAVAPVEQRQLPATLRVVGTIRPDRAATIASEVAGPVAEIPVDEGDYVEAGAVLARLDDSVAKLRLDEARAALAAAAAELTELENGTRPEILARLRSLVEESEAIAQKWEFEKQRTDRLYNAGQTSSKEQHDTTMEYLAAKGRLEQNRALLEEAENGPRAEVIAAARHAVAEQQARVARLQRDDDKTQIRAPFNGFIVARRAEIGEWIEAGGPVADLVAIDTIKVRVDVPERAIAFARAGRPATVEVDALGQNFSAAITRVIPRAGSAARTFPIEIELENAEHRLLPGMFVRTVVPSGPDAERLLVNKDALNVQGLSKQVFVVRPTPEGGYMAMPVSVETGLELADLIQVTGAGLQAGDQVVVRANERLQGPMPVIPTPLARDRSSDQNTASDLPLSRQ